LPYRIDPRTLAVGGSRRITANEVTDFPDPDSPTSPSTSLFPMLKLTSRTAGPSVTDVALRTGNDTVKSRISSSGDTLFVSYQGSATLPVAEIPTSAPLLLIVIRSHCFVVVLT
jgi:hypothetical protein